MLLNFKRSKSLCPYCGQTFDKEEQLNLHELWKHTEEEYYRCDQCQKPFFTKTGLQSHLEQEGPQHIGNANVFLELVLFNTKTLRWECCNCDWSFKEKRDLEEHWEVHKPEPQRDNEQDEGLEDFGGTQKKTEAEVKKEGAHRLNVIRRDLWCDRCQVGFWKEEQYRWHLTCCRKKPGASHCKLCRIEVETEEKLLDHIVQVHSQQFLINGEFYYCHVCQVKFKRLCAFHSHLRLRHMNRNQNEDKDKGEDVGGTDEQNEEEIEVVQITPCVKMEASEEDGGAVIDMEMCDMCGNQFGTLKELMIHERIIHGEVLEGKKKKKKRRWSKRSLEEYRYCKSIIEDLKRKLTRTAKLIRKSVKKRRDQGKKQRNEWSCKITARGIKIYCKEIKEGNGASNQKVIGFKKERGRGDMEVEKGVSLEGSKNVYECIVCGMCVTSVTVLKRHVIRDHRVLEEMGEHQRRGNQKNTNPKKCKRRSRRRKKKIEKKESSLEAIPTSPNEANDSVPIPVFDLEDEEVDVVGIDETEEKIIPIEHVFEVDVQDNEALDVDVGVKMDEQVAEVDEELLLEVDVEELDEIPEVMVQKVEELEIVDITSPEEREVITLEDEVTELVDLASPNGNEEKEVDKEEETTPTKPHSSMTDVADAIEIIEIKQLSVVLEKLTLESLAIMLKSMGLKTKCLTEFKNFNEENYHDKE